MTIMPEQLTDLDFPTPDPLIEIQRELAALTVADPPKPAWDYEKALDDAIDKIRLELLAPRVVKLAQIAKLQTEIGQFDKFTTRMTDILQAMEQVLGADFLICTPSRGNMLGLGLPQLPWRQRVFGF